MQLRRGVYFSRLFYHHVLRAGERPISQVRALEVLLRRCRVRTVGRGGDDGALD